MGSAARTLLLAALGATALAGCKRKPDSTRASVPIAHRGSRAANTSSVSLGRRPPRGAAVAPAFSFSFGIYHLPRAKEDPRAALIRLIRGRPIELNTEPPGDRPKSLQVRFRPATIAELPPPDLQGLKWYGKDLEPREARALQHSRQLSVLTFSGPGASAALTNRIAIELIRDLASATGGLAWDLETHEVFSREAWAARLLDWQGDLPNVTKHIVVHVYRVGELERVATVGMAKFALPDLTVSEVATADADLMGMLVDLVAQSILEGRRVSATGGLAVSIDELEHQALRSKVLGWVGTNAERRATLHVVASEPQLGEADNRWFEIVFPGRRVRRQQRQSELLQKMFGSRSEVESVEHDDAMLAASRRAVAKLMKLKRRFAAAHQGGEVLLVEAPFTTTAGGKEWIWLEVVSWSGSTITGLLQNEPKAVSGLARGSEVEVEESEVFDYLLSKPDGSVEGNETGELVEARRTAREEQAP